MKITYKNRIITIKSVASILIVILLLSIISVFKSALQAVYSQAISSNPQLTNPSVKNSTSNAIANNMTPGIVIAKNIKAPISNKGTLVRTIGIKNLTNIKLPPGIINRTFPLGPLPPGNIPEVIQAIKKLKIPRPPAPNVTFFNKPPTNLTANNNLFNKTTLLKNNVGIRELGAFLLQLNNAINTGHNATHNTATLPAANTGHNARHNTATLPAAKTPSDPLFVNTITGFNGLSECTKIGTTTSCSLPPDVQLAVGPNHVMELVNGAGEIFTKQGSSVSTFFLSSFFGTSDDLTDPKIMYDALSGRWFASIADFMRASVLVAVSTSSDPTVTPGGWKIYNFPFSNCADQPKIGINDDKLAVTVDVFSGNTNACRPLGSFLGGQYNLISKSDLLNGIATPRQQQSVVDSNFYSVYPVHSLGSTSTLFMVNVGAGGGTTAVLSSVTGSVPNAVRTDTILNIFKTQAPPNARQPGTANLIDTGDARVLDAALYGGKLWLTFNDACTPAGDSQPRSCFRIDEIDTSTNSLVLPELEQATSGFDYFYPALRIDGAGNLDILFGYSSVNNYPSLAVTGVAVGTHTMDAPVNFVLGTGPDTEDSCPYSGVTCSRYGDYFGAALDPSNPSIIWGAGEYYSSTSGWLTFVGQMTRSNVWSGFAGLGGYVLGDPAVARNSDGRLEVFVIGADHALYHKSQILAGSSSGWTGFSFLGGYIISNPVVTQNTDGRLEVFVIGADHALYHISQVTAGSSSWTGYSNLGGYIISNPAVARNSDGRLEVFVIGADHALYHDFQLTAGSTTSWSGFTGLGGYIISNPVAGQNADGRLEVFVIGSDHALYHNFQTAPSSRNSWSGFAYLAGYILGDPAVARNSDGRLEVFVIGADHALYHNFQTAPSSSNRWSSYGNLGGTILSNTNPAVSLNSQGQLQVFVVASNNAIFYKFQITPGSSSWSEYVGLGGFVISNPVVATNSDGRMELFVIGSDHALYHNFQLS